MANNIAVNNRYFDMTTVRVSGFPLINSSLWATHVRALKYGRKITVAEVRGTPGTPIARTPGTQACNAGMTVAYEAYSAFMKLLKQGGYNGLSGYDFDVTIDLVIVANGTNPGLNSQVVWQNASIIGDDFNGEQGGTTGFQVNLDVWCQDILIDGVSLYPPDNDNPSPPIPAIGG